MTTMEEIDFFFFFAWLEDISVFSVRINIEQYSNYSNV